MTTVFEEGNLRLDFAGCLKVERFDSPGRPVPEGMKRVDFVVEETRETLLIELKDPSDPGAPKKRREDFVRALQTNELIHQNLVPKARDSYCFLHLMKRDSKPCKYVVCLGVEALSIEPALLLAFKEELLARLRHEAEEPWALKYVSDCVVVTVKNWETHFPKYKITRMRKA